jgi:hypothetical protein
VNTWENLIGSVVEGRYRLRALNYSGRDQAEYLADAAELETRGEPLTVTLIDAAPQDVDTIRTQLNVASRLHHPNLVRIHSAGESAVEGRFMLYLASETPDQTLAAALASGPLPKEAVRGLALHILGALTFLHDQGLAYRALDPETTVRANGRWKLADFGSVCPIGDSSPEPPPYESPYLPPETKTGPVLPGWDIWSLGVILRQALTGQVSKVRRLPRPFDEIVEGCLRQQPEQRLPAQAILHLLGTEPAPAMAPPKDTVAAEAEVRPPAPVAVRTHLPDARPISNVWLSLRTMALIALACLLALLPFGLRKKAPPAAPVVSSVPAPAPAPVRQGLPRPLAMPSAAIPATPSKAGIARAGYISSSSNGRLTASGEPFDSNDLTASTRAYKLGTHLRVTNLKNSKSVVVRVNDRGPRGANIALTERAARELGIMRAGTSEVMLEVLPQ